MWHMSCIISCPGCEYSQCANWNKARRESHCGDVAGNDGAIRTALLAGRQRSIYRVLLGHPTQLITIRFYCRQSVCQPRVFDFIKAIKADRAHKDTHIGTAGFCWGGQHSIALAAHPELTVCNFVAHPSFLTYPTDIEAIKVPLSVAAAEHDPQMSPANAKQTEEILAAKTAKGKDAGVEHEFRMYHSVTHGFAVRADLDAKHEAEAGKQAEDQAVEWFSRWMA